jgi:hypothetical protein
VGSELCIRDSPSTTIDTKNKARIKLSKLLVEQKARKKAEDEGKIKEHLESVAEREKKESIAKDLETKSIIGYFTEDERKEIAKNIRADMNKSDEKKALDLLKKALKGDKDEGKGGEEGGKGGGGGGGKGGNNKPGGGQGGDE